jgi:hypothetical protein
MRLMPGVSFAARYVIQGRVRDSRLYREVPAIDALSDEPVMLWLVRQRFLPTPHAQARFLAEAGRLHRVKLDGTVHVNDAGVDGENVYVAVPDLRPKSPTVPQLEHGRGIAAALGMAAQVAPILDRAHLADVIHGYLCMRDLVFLRDRVMLGGAGLWRMLERVPLVESLSDEHSLSPEARVGGIVTAKSDVYGFAALCARFVLGIGAMEGSLLAELELRLPRLAVALGPALSEDPEERPSTCRAVLEALESAFLPVKARGTVPPLRADSAVIGAFGGAFRGRAQTLSGTGVPAPAPFPRAPSSQPVAMSAVAPTAPMQPMSVSVPAVGAAAARSIRSSAPMQAQPRVPTVPPPPASPRASTLPGVARESVMPPATPANVPTPMPPTARASSQPIVRQQQLPSRASTVPPPPARFARASSTPPVGGIAPPVPTGTTPDELDAALAALDSFASFDDAFGELPLDKDGSLPDTLREKISLPPPHAPAPPPRGR